MSKQGGQIMKRDDRADSVRALIMKFKPQIQMALPKHLDVDRMMRITLTAISKTPDLLNCDQKSLLGAVIQASQLGLEVDGSLGRAYLIPYGRTATLIVGYRGLVDLARRSGQVSTIFARVVRVGDYFDYQYGLTEKLEHKPCDDITGEITHAYAVCHLKDGGVQFDVMTRAEVDAIRKRSRAGNSGPWVTDYAEMAKKTALRRLCKLLPMSTDLARAVSIEEHTDAGLPQQFDVIDMDAESSEEPAGTPAQPVDMAAEAAAVEAAEAAAAEAERVK